MKNNLTLGSLFDGIGAVPYAASFLGIKPIWASEILPNAVSVTKRHFPEMEHLGDITKVNGGEIQPVHIIAFGSPCQSFSVAGNRTSFNGKSGLFFEAIRIIKEMRCATNGKFPEIVLFENVLGLLSVDSRRSYKTVLEAFCEAEIPMPKSGRWANAGMVRGRGIDLAWVIKDAQYYRTAQRRKRLFLVADFRGQRAGEILFVSKSLSGYFAACKSEGKGFAADAESGVGNAGRSINAGIAGTLDANYGKGTGMRGGIERDVVLCAATGQRNAEILTNLSATLNCNCEQPIIYMTDHKTADIAYTMRLREGCAGGGKGPLIQTEKSGTLAAGNDQYLFRADKQQDVHPEKSGTLCASGAGLSRPAGMASETDLCVAYCLQGNMIGRKDENGPQGKGVNENQSFTLNHTDRHCVAYAMTMGNYISPVLDQSPTLMAGANKDRPFVTLTEANKNVVAAVDCRNFKEVGDISGTLQAKNTAGYSLNFQNPVRTGYIVRRLTPMEAERLMSLPDDWTKYGYDGKLISDSARYQLCGNSIVANCLAYIMQNIVEYQNDTEGAI